MKGRGIGDVEFLRKLREVIALLGQEPDPQKLVPSILDRALALMNGERGFVILADPIKGKFTEVAAARNLDREEILKPAFKFSRSVVERVARTLKAECISDATEAEKTRDVASVKNLQLRSILCVPLLVSGQPIGVVYVDHRYMTGAFDEDDLQALETFAVPAALALDGARRMAELARHRDELTRRVETIEQLRAELAERYRERSREVQRLRTRVEPVDSTGDDAELEAAGIVARSAAMKRVLALVRKVAPSEAPILILGESGVGKEVVARLLHALSQRSKGPFVSENCAALADPLLESELFGHEEGAFTGAVKPHAGLFEVARGGTLLLDEVGEMSAGLQAKLLRVIQERSIRRVGGEKALATDVRILAATHRDLESMVAEGSFRQDLFYRLNVVRIEIPPLRERPEDVPALIDRAIERSSEAPVVFEPQAREILLSYPWPGNVRELENEVHRLIVLAGPGGTVRPSLLSSSILAHAGAKPARPSSAVETGGDEPEDAPIEGVWRLEEVEKEMFRRALRRARGNRSMAARLLGLAKSSFYHRAEKLGLLGPATSTDDESGETRPQS